MRTYHEPEPYTAAEVLASYEAGAPDVNSLLVGAAFHDPDRLAVQTLCLRFLEVDDAGLAGLAATCLGHLARIHRTLDLDVVAPALRAHQHDPAIGGRAEDAFDDIETYLGVRLHDR